MPRLLMMLVILWMLTGGPVSAQVENSTPPVVALITISEPDSAGIVTISGAAGAVFPGAQVAVRNLYTEDIVYTQAGITGTFTARLFGPYNTPFWISAARSIPNTLRDRPGSLPGGPGTIIYGPFPDTVNPDQPSTALIIDGLLDDWLTYITPVELASDGPPDVYALRNQESLYIGFGGVRRAPGYNRVQVIFTLDGSTYSLNLDPRLTAETATWSRLSPNAADLGTLAVAAAQDQAVEMRVPLAALRPIIGATIESATLNTVAFLAGDGTALQNYSVDQPIEPVEERDGTTFAQGRLDNDATAFYIAGQVAGGTSRWQALGQIDTLNPAPGGRVRLLLDTVLDAPELPESLVGLTLRGALYLQPVAGSDERIVVSGPDANNGVSSVLTPGGLAIDNLASAFLIGTAVAPAPQVVRRDEQLLFGLDFDIELPPDLPAGFYVPVFRGLAQVGDGEVFAWEDSSLLGTGPALTRPPENRLPLILNVGSGDAARLVWSLWHDTPSNGSRGVLAQEDAGAAALSNRVRFNSATYILPPNSAGYPLEPYVLSQMPNAADYSSAPLVPFLFPGGRLQVRVTRPDGTVDNLGTVSVAQGQLSTETLDEITRFGGQGPLDAYRLTTLDPQLAAYPFDTYGGYEIEVLGSVEDVWGNRYTGGGTYPLLIAESLQILPGALPGTPFLVGDVLNTGVRVSPAAAAEITVTVRVYPLAGGAVREQVISGTANSYGYFHGEPLRFDTPGEYVVDYEARFTDAEGRLWAASQRGAGVIAAPASALIGRGVRGLDGYYPELRPAWFNTALYAPDTPPLRFNYPYHGGDVLWYADTPDNQVNPVIQVQDTVGDYAAWLVAQFPDYVSEAGLTMAQLAQRDSLPVLMVGDSPYGVPLVPDAVVNEAYTYLSAVRPGVTLRQLVLGSPADERFPVYWGPDDPYNNQIGAGNTGDLPGDYTFLFGGAVIRNEAAGVYETALYGALAVVVEPRTEFPRVYPPFRGGTAARRLLLVLDEPAAMLFHPTGTLPGQVLRPGETLTVAGHVAPALASRVQAVITDPDGEVRQTLVGYANPVGYFYDDAHDIEVDKPGIWTVEVHVQHDGLTAAGEVAEPLPEGVVPGTVTGRYPVYVVPADAPPLEWNDDRAVVTIPGALPYNFNFPLPADWTDIQIDHTVTTPSYVLDSGPLASSGGSFSYQYNPTNLSRDFSNLELDARLEGPSIVDPVTLTFVITGTDAAGRTQVRSRSFTIMYDRLMTLEG